MYVFINGVHIFYEIEIVWHSFILGFNSKGIQVVSIYKVHVTYYVLELVVVIGSTRACKSEIYV